MSDKKQNKVFASFATASTLSDGSIEAVVGTVETVINLQLADWKAAKRRYFEKRNNLSEEDMVFIINHLTSSLSILFGANYLGDSTSNTPQLKQLIDVHRSKSDIKMDKIVYRGFLDLIDFFDATSRHHDQSKRPKVLELTKFTIERLLETTKRIWIWFGKTTSPKNEIPEYLLLEFKDDFYHFPK